ncbi:hypothetical protein COCVIDRAFT_93052 [Bipolaris victoriae FI3]|uniref:Uncharacterized protein n=2 Tax=Bipolaris TaxID=33194 RepID=W6YQQ9_COCC2|nr:uncharacterized protein COCCADRAFT_84865 [Bipolaris zeicola 26-R-13]XP_014558955.1 hypothetical protein COCVIDRAFT_93052 [Bipolaris victoriae FI3]EUC37784.1 hypothetical protein COCCADRAFT_84865 [Bipolaris zeicola 26-R-13]
MGHFEFRELGAICNYVRSKYEERAETKGKRRRSMSDAVTERKQKYGKLHKPPTVQSLHQRQDRPRSRLQKSRPQSMMSLVQPLPKLFVLEYDPYPYNTQPCQFLGVFSSIDTVTAGAFQHGAYSFSREGLLDGSEYLSPTGRIKIVSHSLQSTGVTAAVPGETPKKDGQHMRLDIPHPLSQPVPRFDSHQDLNMPKRSEVTVYLALHESPNAAFCIGLFTSKSLAWGACLKDKAWLEWTDKVVEQKRDVGENNLPRVEGRLVGSGRHVWYVKESIVNDVRK